MSQKAKLKQAIQLLKELNCPKEIMDALDIWGMFDHDDESRLHNWEALADGNMVDAESVREVPDEERLIEGG